MSHLKPGQSAPMNIHAANGRLLFVVLVSLFTDGVSLTFSRHPILDRQFTNLAEGRAYLRFLKAEAAAGTALWQIIERAGMWTSAASAVDQALIDSLNADMDATAERRDASELTADCRDIVADGNGWNALRQQTRRDFSRTRTHRQDPTPAELARMRAHNNGIVTCGPGQNWTLLRGIVRRGLAVEHEVHGRYAIRSVRLNQRGMAAIQNEEIAA